MQYDLKQQQSQKSFLKRKSSSKIKRKILRSELYLADEIFLTGTAAHITSVGNIDNRAIGNGKKGKFTKELQRIYFDAVSGKKEDYLEWCTPLEI